MAMKAIEWILDLIYPPRCILCHRLLRPGEKTLCRKCADRLPDYDGAEPQVEGASRCVVTFFYDDLLRASFLRYKFSGLRQYAGQYGAWMAVTIRDKLDGKFDCLTYAPVSAKRRRQRGYDQSELLCRAIARELEMPMVRALEKHADTPAQSGLSDAAQRAANVSGAYRAVAREAFCGRRVLLIDDIVTTGATLSECCRVLRDAGAADVVCAALASRHGMDPDAK